MDTILNKLEYMQIIQIIEKYCKTYLGKNYCVSLVPSFATNTVTKLLQETNEASKLLVQKGTPPLFELETLETYIKMLESGQTLSIKGLLEVCKLLQMSYELRNYFFKDENLNLASFNNKDFESSSTTEDFNLSTFCALEPYFSNLYTNPSTMTEISSKLLDENTVADNASSKLSSLRKNRKNIEGQIKDKLNAFVHSSKYLMEPIITIRNNRYVVPVKEEYRDMVKGFIHDTSSSGSTLYIEPMTIFELNNQMNHIKMEEEIEIEKILQMLSGLLFPVATQLQQNLSLVGNIDLIFAKAVYGNEQNAIIPQMNDKKIIDFAQARHPLLDRAIAIPITVSLGKDFDCLLITGPNTGGKTVALKTIGLLLLMAYSGIPIPCHETSSIYVFSKLFVDIGDEQSIEQSLSTFSAHMKNIVTITNEANENTLVLLDELGSGTDPLEGSALAISILENLNQKGALICCTTHYPELKEFALVTDGFENASFEFDLENLKPTYHLLIGIPGKSNAFEISKKLGLSSAILQNATSFLKEDKIGIEELLKNIYDDKLTIEKEKEEIQKNLNQITTLRQNLEQEQTTFTSKKKELLEKARNEARDIILDAKEEVNSLLKLLTDKHVNIKQANHSRDKLNQKLKDLSPVSELIESANESLEIADVKENMLVWIPSLQTSGTILSSHITKSNEVLVQVGFAKMNMKLSKLSKMKASNSSNLASTNSITTSKVSTDIGSKTQFVPSEINVIGQTVEDAIYVIDKYIDNCVLAHLSPIRIVHGKGTGKLRMRYS